MVTRPDPQDLEIIIRFGGGLNTRATPDQINAIECTAGENFDLVFDNTRFRGRNAFDLIGTAPNLSEIRGFATLDVAGKGLSILVQAGGTVYDWDGVSTFTSVGTVNSGARLRGQIEANSSLDQKVIITDLALAQEVMTWDGTSFVPLPHNLGGSFLAKYAFVENERAFYANVKAGTTTPHMIVGSAREAIQTLSVTDRPSSALSEADPFFLLAPDLRPLNAIVEAFGETVFSTERGQVFKLTGSSAKDFAIDELYPLSGAVGNEPMVFIGNDIAYGRPGAIELLSATEKAGDVESDDLTRQIFDDVRDVDDWTLVYSSRFKKVYCFNPDLSRLFVLYTPFLGQEVSPWSLWRTDHALSFQPTAVMRMRRPTDGLETVFMGDASGNVYELEGLGTTDGGTTAIETTRTSQLYAVPQGASAANVSGWVLYTKEDDAVLTLVFETEGNSRDDRTKTINITRESGASLYANAVYYNDDAFYGTVFRKRLGRQPFAVTLPGDTSHFRVTAEIQGTFQIHEVGIQFTSAT